MLCVVCGSDFDNWGNQKYCSRRCQKKHILIASRKDREERTVVCPQCGETFKTWSTVKKYCDTACSIAAQGSRRRDKK